jgi:5-formyltetrahydrofolate cyclo-ligase
MALNRSQLRRHLLGLRGAVDPGTARRAGMAASRRAWLLPLLRRARRIATYVPMRGEFDCRAFIQQAWDRGREVYLPVLHGKRLRFRAYTPATLMRPNRFGIPEPSSGKELSPQGLDVAITPLVGFDLEGNRLGMGGGYYDRSFHFLRQRVHWAHPRLIGFAYESQCVESLVRFDWDVPLDAVVTEYANYIFPV